MGRGRYTLNRRVVRDDRFKIVRHGISEEFSDLALGPLETHDLISVGVPLRLLLTSIGCGWSWARSRVTCLRGALRGRMAWTHDQKLGQYEALMASVTDDERNAKSMPKATTRKKPA
jgi:hypothetical protein